MKRDTLILGGLVVVAAGCSAFPGLPSQLQPPSSSTQAQQQADPALMDVSIKLNLGGSDRAVQYNGGTGSLLNDINNIVVGLFDNGSGSSFVASLGYLYSGAIGSTPAATTITTTSAPYITDLYTSRLGSVGTLGTNCSCTISTDKSNVRRYLLRDYGTASTYSITGTTLTVFTKIPAGGSSGHTYVIFAAAYDSAANSLGYGEAALTDSVTAAAAGSSTAATITLNLKNNVFTANLSEGPTLVPFVPSATLRSLLP